MEATVGEPSTDRRPLPRPRADHIVIRPAVAIAGGAALGAKGLDLDRLEEFVARRERMDRSRRVGEHAGRAFEILEERLHGDVR